MEFHIHDDAAYGDVPIDFAGGILNTESPEWEIEPGGIMVDELAVDEVTLPIQFALYQNYPNPFNPTTTLRFGLPQPSNIEFRIINILGQEVATIFSGWQDMGFYEYRWSGLNDLGQQVSNGVYFSVLTNGRAVKVRKMLLVK